jgi:hypothetical protein
VEVGFTDRLLPTQRESQVGPQLSGILDAMRGSDLLRPVTEPQPAGPNKGTPDTVTFSYIDDAIRTAREGTFPTNAVPAELQSAYESARAVFAAAADVYTDAAPFLSPLPKDPA